MNLRKDILKKIAQGRLEREYGFGPALKNITLLEASGDGQYILCEIKFGGTTHEYSMDGITVEKRK